jgi:hypothetical protein
LAQDIDDHHRVLRVQRANLEDNYVKDNFLRKSNLGQGDIDFSPRLMPRPEKRRLEIYWDQSVEERKG